MRFTERLRETSRVAHKLTVVRSMHHPKSGASGHPDGTRYMLSGAHPGSVVPMPDIGSVVSQVLGSRCSFLPTYTMLSEARPRHQRELPGILSDKFPDITSHVIPCQHPEPIVINKDTGGMPRGPGGVRYFVPVHAIIAVPDIFAVATPHIATFHDPEPTVEDGDFVILPRFPRRSMEILSPGDAVCGTPDIIEKLSTGDLWSVVGAASENPDFAVVNGTAADHATLGPERFLRLDFRPVNAIGARPDIPVKTVLRLRRRRPWFAHQ